MGKEKPKKKKKMQSMNIEHEVQQLFNTNNEQNEALQKIIDTFSKEQTETSKQPPKQDYRHNNKLLIKIKNILNLFKETKI